MLEYDDTRTLDPSTWTAAERNRLLEKRDGDRSGLRARSSTIVAARVDREDFSDSESQRVLEAAALAMIDVLARQAADDYINEQSNQPKDADEESCDLRPLLD
jgi:hypothetical protein